MKALFEYATFSVQPVLAAEAASRSRDGGLGLFLAGIGILVFILAALILLISLRQKHRLNLFCGLLAVLFAGAAMVLCLAAGSVGTMVAKPSGDPQEAVSGFFDALCAGDYEGACGYLNGVTDLGLSGQPSDPVGQTMFAALQSSYSYALNGSCIQEQLSARQEVLFTYLDLTSIASDVGEETMTVLDSFVQERPRSQLYDSNNEYLPEVTQEAYAQAVDRVLKRAGDYYVTASLQLDLQYVDGAWLLTPNQAFLKAITGGAV